MSSAGTVRKTPGVYVKELSAFPPSVVGVATAIPIFVGYTEFARDPLTMKQLYMQAVEITSMADYYSYFGQGYDSKYEVVEVTPPTDGSAFAYDFEAVKTAGTPPVMGYYEVSNHENKIHFNLFSAMKLFYANGGGTCYVVAVCNYGGKTETTPFTGAGVPIDSAKLVTGLAVANDKVGPTMIVVPDACVLSTDAQKLHDPTKNGGYNAVVLAALEQASTLQDRVAILDLPEAMDTAKWTKDGLAEERDAFYVAISPGAPWFSYGAAYAPTLQTSVIGTNDIDYTNLQATDTGSTTLGNLLTIQANALYTGTNLTQVTAKLATAFPTNTVTDPSELLATNQYLVNALPLLGQVEGMLLNKLNASPPSGVMAGIWTQNDLNRGVWNAPANLSAAAVIAPEVLLTNGDQEDYNVPLNGNAIDVLRAFTGRGTVVWGARTLDGNSNDYRYIQVRRTLVYIEQSIKTALQPFVFAANDGQTWVTVTGLISNFLTGLWTQGGLMGDKASDAFTVQCGLGSTMTGQDILNGYMIVAVTLQMIHPAEFIELTFKQQMQGV